MMVPSKSITSGNCSSLFNSALKVRLPRVRTFSNGAGKYYMCSILSLLPSGFGVSFVSGVLVVFRHGLPFAARCSISSSPDFPTESSILLVGTTCAPVLVGEWVASGRSVEWQGMYLWLALQSQVTFLRRRVMQSLQTPVCIK